MASPFTVISSKDTNIRQYWPTTNYGSDTDLRINAGSADTPPDIRRSLVEVPVVWGTDIPAGAIITLATLYLYITAVDGNSPVGRTYYCDRLLRADWHETQSTWNIFKTSNNWTTAGANGSGTDYTATNRASAVVPAIPNWISWDITEQVKVAQAGSINVICLVRDSDESDTGSKSLLFVSREYTIDTTLRPKLVITYTTISDMPFRSYYPHILAH